MKLFEKIREQSPFEPIVFPEGVKYGEKSLVGYGAKISASERSEKMLYGRLDDKAYQIIAAGDSYYIVCVENGNFITDFDNMSYWQNSFIMKKDSIHIVSAWLEYHSGDNSTVKRAEIKFNWSEPTESNKNERQSFYISLAHDISSDTLKSFFYGVNEFKIKPYEDFEKPKFNQKEKKFCASLYRVSFILLMASVVSSVIALLPTFRPVSAFVSIIPLLCFLCYILFTKYFTITDITTQDEYETGVDMRFTMVYLIGLCTVPSFLYCIFNSYPVLDSSKLGILFLALFGVCIVLLLLRSAEARKNLKALVILTLCLAIASFSAIELVNTMCPSEVTSYTTVVTDKYTTQMRKRRRLIPKTYYHITARVQDKTVSFDVDSEYYNSIDVGDEINIDKYDGALGIQYVKLDKGKQ